MLSANASMYSIIPSIFWLLYQSLLFFSFPIQRFPFFIPLFVPLLHGSHRALQIFPVRLDTAHSRAISARRSVFRVFSDIPLSCCLFSFILFFILSQRSGNGNSVLRFFLLQYTVAVNYMSTVYIPYFSTNFRLLLCLFLLFFCLSFTRRSRKKLRSLFFPQSFSFRFCFTPNRAPQGSPAWSSHSAPSLPFFSGRYTQWKAPTFPQSADGSS